MTAIYIGVLIIGVGIFWIAATRAWSESRRSRNLATFQRPR